MRHIGPSWRGLLSPAFSPSRCPGPQLGAAARMPRSLLSPLVLTLVIGLFPTVAPAQESVPDCSIPTAWTRVPPDAEEVRIRVEVALWIFDILDVDETRQSFTADFAVLLSWRDHRLSEASRGSSLEDCVVATVDVWHPSLEVVNQRQLQRHYEENVEVDADGTVRFLQRYSGELSVELDLREFPFDTQKLPVQLISFTHGPDEVELVMDRDLSAQRGNFTVAGWDTVDIETRLHSERLEGSSLDFLRVDHSVVLARNPGYYVWNIFVPLGLIAFMAWTVFWVDPHRLEAQVGVSTAAALTLIAFLLSLRQTVPRVDYLTRADQLVLGSALLVFLALGESIWSSRLAGSGRDAAALRLDRWSRVVYALGFLLVLLWSLVL